jgi:hypothetical protein
LVLALLLGLIEPGVLYADPSRKDREQPGRDEVTSYAFEDELVAGDTAGPSGDVLLVRHASGTGSLVRARVSFVDKLMKSVEAL